MESMRERVPHCTLLFRPSIAAAAGLIGGFAAARYSGRRDIGGALFATAGIWCAWQWSRSSGPVTAAVLSAVYAAAMGGSHPLAARIGAWPSVLTVTAATAAASEALSHRRAR